MNNTLFVIKKGCDIKVLDTKSALHNMALFQSDGWKHTSTIDARGFIARLCDSTDKEIIKGIRELTNEDQ